MNDVDRLAFPNEVDDWFICRHPSTSLCNASAEVESAA